MITNSAKGNPFHPSEGNNYYHASLATAKHQYQPKKLPPKATKPQPPPASTPSTFDYPNYSYSPPLNSTDPESDLIKTYTLSKSSKGGAKHSALPKAPPAQPLYLSDSDDWDTNPNVMAMLKGKTTSLAEDVEEFAKALKKFLGKDL